ncbi:MAG TPA: glycosyltransferase, partial [Planctomycetaceae bacterium]
MSGQKALLIVHDFPPTSSAGVFRTVRFAKYLPAYGWEPLVLTASVGSGDEGGRRLLRDLPDGLRIERIRPWSWRRSAEKRTGGGGSSAESLEARDRNGMGRERGLSMRIAASAWQFLTETPDRQVWWVGPAVRAGRRLIREHRPEIVYTSGPPHSVHLIGLRLKRVEGLPWVADFRDPWARRPWAKRRNPWGNRLAGRFERFCVRFADRVILNTDAAAEEFRRAYPGEPAEKFDVIPNGCDPDLAARAEAFLREASVRDRGLVRLLHPGS